MVSSFGGFDVKPMRCKNCSCERFKVACGPEKNILVVRCAKCGSAVCFWVSNAVEGCVVKEPVPKPKGEGKRRRAEWVEENVLPSVQGARFELCADAMYWIDDEGAKHRIVKAGVCANGVRDLCIYWKGPSMNDVTVGKTAEVAKERVLWVPKGDILWMKFEPPLDGNRCSFYLDIGSDAEIKGMVREMFRRFGGKKGSGYDMFGGEQYRDA